jgi:hypothetical protein
MHTVPTRAGESVPRCDNAIPGLAVDHSNRNQEEDEDGYEHGCKQTGWPSVAAAAAQRKASRKNAAR